MVVWRKPTETELENPVIKVDELACERGGLPLFSRLNLSVSSGELVQITGPNGCGKTTLLRLLAGLSLASEGVVSCSTSERLYLGHRLGIKNQLSPVENLHWYFPEKTEAELRTALAQWDLQGYESLRCEQLSAGQNQRVALSRLLLSDAQLWLLDEPFTAIDQSGVERLEACLLEAAAKGVAIIFTSHHIFSHTNGPRIFSLEGYLP